LSGTGVSISNDTTFVAARYPMTFGQLTSTSGDAASTGDANSTFDFANSYNHAFYWNSTEKIFRWYDTSTKQWLFNY